MSDSVLDPANFTAFSERHPDRHYAWRGIVSLGKTVTTNWDVEIRVCCPHKHRNVVRADDCARRLLVLATAALVE